MQERINEELKLIRHWFPNVEYHEEGHWILIPSFHLSIFLKGGISRQPK